MDSGVQAGLILDMALDRMLATVGEVKTEVDVAFAAGSTTRPRPRLEGEVKPIFFKVVRACVISARIEPTATASSVA